MKIKTLLIILPSILLIAIIASLIITVINIKTNNVTVSYSAFKGTNPSSTVINPPTASTVIYSSTGGVIGKIYGQEEKAYQYEENPSLYQGTSILYHLINIPPYSSNHTDLAIAIKLKDQLLTMLLNIGAITKADINQEKINTETPYFQVDQDPYFTEYVINKLMAKYSNYVLAGGLKVYTTVNTQIDNMAQQVVSQDYQKYVAPVDANSAALVADNPQNGYILAMIGGPSYQEQQLNMADEPRQQGSAMKPLIYVKAFEMGYSPNTMIDDAPICYGSYCPVDYEGYTVGWVSIDRAINQSINIPAIKMLAAIGYQNGVNTLESEGIKLNPNTYYGLPLVLGDAGLTLTNMVGAYNALANGGYYAQSTPFEKIVESNGAILLNNTNLSQKRILNANAVAEMDQVLGDTSLKAPMYGSVTYYYSVQGREYGSKDGTSNGPKDVTDYMFIPQLSVGGWAGNTNDTNMTQYAVGAFQAGPMVHDFIMNYIQMENLPVENFPTPTYPTLNSTTSQIP